MTSCPDCGGAGKIQAIADPGCRLIVIPCRFCKTTGAVSAVELGRRAAGQAHRLARMARDESLFECAKRLGVRSSQVSDYERGLRVSLSASAPSEEQ